MLHELLNKRIRKMQYWYDNISNLSVIKCQKERLFNKQF